MSDQVMGRDEHPRRRASLSLLVAAGVHVAALAAAGIVLAVTPKPAPLDMSVDVQLPAAPVEQAPAASLSDAAGSVAVPGSGAAASLPRAAGASTVATGSDFVIPTPRAQPSASAATPTRTGPAFRTAGGSAGGAASLPSAPSSLPSTTVAGNQAGTSSSSTGTGASQRGGVGVAPSDLSAGATKATVDLGAVDKTIAGATKTAAGAGSAGGGTGSTSSGGSGSAAVGTGAGSSGNVGPGLTLSWSAQDASTNRRLVTPPAPKIPDSAGTQGLTLTVTVSFSLDANGLVSGVAVEKGSGNTAVDSAVVQAVQHARFSTAPGAGPVTGLFTYVIKPK